jgi:serine/threonine-protein kinase
MPLTLDPALSGLPAALSGEFELERELGRGGMGVVFLARDVRLDRPVALKVLPPDLGQNADVRARFLREARTAGQLSHPNIVPVHRADERGGFAFFAMGLVDGDTAGQRVKDRGALPPSEVVRHLREVAWALAYAHARGARPAQRGTAGAASARRCDRPVSRQGPCAALRERRSAG